MLLGEYEHTLDDKKRLTLPAKFRRDFEDGCVVSRGLDGCLVAWTPEGWDKYEETTLSTLNQLSREERQLRRYLLSGATDTTPDRQGRCPDPTDAGRAREARSRRRRHRSQRPPRDLGPRRVAPRALRGRREC